MATVGDDYHMRAIWSFLSSSVLSVFFVSFFENFLAIGSYTEHESFFWIANLVHAVGE